MSLFGECTLKNLTAEYVEEQMALNAPDISTNTPEDKPAPVEEVTDISTNDAPVAPTTVSEEPVEEVSDISVNDVDDTEVLDEQYYLDCLIEALD